MMVVIPSLGVAFCWIVVVCSLSGASFFNFLEGGPFLMLETESSSETCSTSTLGLLKNLSLCGDVFNFEGEPTTLRGSRVAPPANLGLL